MNTFTSKRPKIPLHTKEEFQELLKNLKLNQYKSSLYIYDDNLCDINAERRINFTKCWLNISDLNPFKFSFDEDEEIREQQISKLSQSIKFNNNVKLLLLDGQKLSQNCFHNISSCLSVNNSINYLSLHSSNLSDLGCKYLSKALVNNRILETLMLENNSVGILGCKYFAESLKNNNTLTSIILRGNKIGDQGAKFLGEMLKENRSIQSLGIGDNDIGDDGFYYIFEGLENNSVLRNLWMSENKGTSITAGFLSEILLNKNSNLTSIWANNNLMKDEGAQEISEALKSNENLKTLTLDLNQFTSKGLISIAEALKYNYTLANLWLDGNEFEDEVIIKFAEMLKFSNSIETIWFNGNNITSRAYDKLACCLVFNENINTILFGGDKLGEDFNNFVKKVEEINKENKNLNDLFLISEKSLNLKNLENDLKSKPSKFANDKAANIKNNSSLSDKSQKEKEFEKNGNNPKDFQSSNFSDEFIEQNLSGCSSGTRNLTINNSLGEEIEDEINSFEEKDKSIKDSSESIFKKFSDIVSFDEEERQQLESRIIKLQNNKKEKKFHQINIEKCYKAFKYLLLLEKTFLDCLKVKKIFEDENLSCIEKNFMDHLKLNENEITQDEFFKNESDLDFTDNNLENKLKEKKEILKNRKIALKINEKKNTSSNKDTKNSSSKRNSNEISDLNNECFEEAKNSEEIRRKSTESSDSNFPNCQNNLVEDLMDNKANNTNNIKLINYEELEFLKDDEDKLQILKRGAFSKILLGTYWDSIVLVKQIEINKIDYRKFMEELNELINNPYPCYNNILGYSVTNTQIHIVYELKEYCSLSSIIHQKKIEIPIDNLISYVNQLILYINYLHKKDIVISYKDLNLSNLNISKNGENLIVDIFGFSNTFYINKSKNIKYCGTISYMAPELFIGEELNFSADIYSLGIIMYEIFSSKYPYEGKRDKDIIMEVVRGIRPDLNLIRKDTPEVYIDLIRKCLDKDPQKRPNIQDIIYLMEQ